MESAAEQPLPLVTPAVTISPFANDDEEKVFTTEAVPWEVPFT